MHILCDVDGVLADFYGQSVLMHGRDPASLPVNEWDIPAMLGMSEEAFWLPLDNYGFWMGVPAYPWAQDLVAALSSFGPVTFATSPSHSSQSYAAKVDWLRHFFGKDVRVMLGSQKWLMAGNGNVLVDDYHKNCNEFVEHGGHAIMFPQRWNALHAFAGDKVRYIASLLEQASNEMGA